jgi:hypothetical protein
MLILIQLRRSVTAIALLLLLTACGGRSVNKKTARDVLLQNPAWLLKQEDIAIDSVNQTGTRDAVVEARLRVAFRYEKDHGRWVIREVRLGQGQWQSLDEFLRALQRARLEGTQRILEQVAAATEKYRQKNGGLPDFKDYISLSDLLAPEYLNPLLRLDEWQNPLAAYRVNPNTIRLVSPGPDGRLGTGDDIELTRTYAMP